MKMMKKNIIAIIIGALVIGAIAGAAIYKFVVKDDASTKTEDVNPTPKPTPEPQPQPIPQPEPSPTPIPKPRPIPPPNTCGSVSSCQNGEACPSGYECSGLPAYGCYPPGCPTPICLSSSTLISTPEGDVQVTDLREGMMVWSLDKDGNPIAEPVVRVTRIEVRNDHQVVDLVLSDGRELQVSPGHPTIDGRSVGELNMGDSYDGAIVEKALLVPYEDEATYDLLPAGETGYYLANGVLLGSTLK